MLASHGVRCSKPARSSVAMSDTDPSTASASRESPSKATHVRSVEPGVAIVSNSRTAMAWFHTSSA
jgi:hypothetical protein